MSTLRKGEIREYINSKLDTTTGELLDSMCDVITKEDRVIAQNPIYKSFINLLISTLEGNSVEEFNTVVLLIKSYAEVRKLDSFKFCLSYETIDKKFNVVNLQIISTSSFSFMEEKLRYQQNFRLKTTLKL